MKFRNSLKKTITRCKELEADVEEQGKIQKKKTYIDTNNSKNLKSN